MNESAYITGIMGAMPEEIEGITQIIDNRTEVALGGRIYHLGTINGCKVVVVFSRWGKVAAAATAATLLLKFKVNELIFTGVAGALSAELNIGDIVVGRRLYQHDMDARPFIPRFEIPLLGLMNIECKPPCVEIANNAATRVLVRERLGGISNHNGFVAVEPKHPKVHVGDIASGDRFISSSTDRMVLKEILPSVLCVEMEGAAVAQVCHEYDIPWTVIRIISDTADDSAAHDFQHFIKNIASGYTVEIVREMIGCREENI